MLKGRLTERAAHSRRRSRHNAGDIEMAFTRRNVWELGGDWADPILWYARGVKAMRSRALNDPSGWRFFGALHGFKRELWQKLGYLGPADQLPSNADIRTYWSQCQHGSWYFLPWHRGYVIALEATIRDAVIKLGGPADWALPYWNYSKPNQNRLPPAFASRDWPDGQVWARFCLRGLRSSPLGARPGAVGRAAAATAGFRSASR